MAEVLNYAREQIVVPEMFDVELAGLFVGVCRNGAYLECRRYRMSGGEVGWKNVAVREGRYKVPRVFVEEMIGVPVTQQMYLDRLRELEQIKLVRNGAPAAKTARKRGKKVALASQPTVDSPTRRHSTLAERPDTKPRKTRSRKSSTKRPAPSPEQGTLDL